MSDTKTLRINAGAVIHLSIVDGPPWFVRLVVDGEEQLMQKVDDELMAQALYDIMMAQILPVSSELILH
jgi:hypothetical protein